MSAFWKSFLFSTADNPPSLRKVKSKWLAKKLRFEEVSEKIPNGSHIYIGSTAATARDTLNAVVKGKKRLLDINILQFIPGGKLPHLEEPPERFRTTAFFAFGSMSQRLKQGIADYIPLSSSRLYRLMREKRMPVDVAIVKLTPPDKRGYCNLGMGVDFSKEAVASATLVIAEICESMPWTEGDSLVHVEDIDWWVEHNSPMPTHEELFGNVAAAVLDPEVLDRLAKNVLFEIPDGATLKFDLNLMTNNIVPYLSERKNLGLHSDLLNNELLELIKAGVINNSQKNIDKGKTVVCHAFGDQNLYDYIDRNPDIEFRPSYRVNRLDFVATQHNLISIISGLKVDLSGQVAVDSVGNRYYAGVGSADDSIKGAGYSPGGKPIVVLPSKSIKGNSNIVFTLPEGTGVVITRIDVHYVITEYGTAFLFGKNIRERCLALIDIAHPDSREKLLENAKANYFVHQQQPGHSFTSSYPKEWENLHTTKQRREVLVRPIKAIDEDLLRDFFHKLSDQNVYMRYFAQLRSLPQKVLKSFSDIDYSTDMALVALSPPETANHEIVAIGQWIVDPEDNVPEIAFQVRDDWQGEGLGKFMLEKLMEIARNNGIKYLKADVLADNQAMNIVFEQLQVPYKRKSEVGVFHYIFELSR